MVGYSRERVEYRLFDLKDKLILEERNVIFDEHIKESYSLNERKRDDTDCINWNIENIINTSDNDNISIDGDIEKDVRSDEQSIDNNPDSIRESDPEDDFEMEI